MANTDVYVNKITLPKDRSNTYTGILVDRVSQKCWYGTSSTTASTQTKTVTCTGFYLETGAIISVAFTNANTYASATLQLNVNSTGNKWVYLNNASTSSANNLLWSANSVLTFIYDGTNFHFISKGVNGATVWYGTSSTTASTQEKATTISDYFLEKGSLVVVDFSTANTYTSAKITLNVNNTGAKNIYYNGSVTSSSNTLLWEANTTLTFVYNGTGYVYVTSSKGGSVKDVQIGGTSILSSGVANIVTNSTYNSSTNKIATMSDVPSVTSTYSSTGTTAVTGTAVNAALQTLDSSISSTTNQAISAITITDGKIASSSKIDVTPKLNWYGTCSTTASTSEKAVTCSGYTLNAGNIIGVLFGTDNTAAAPTLNINSTGAKTVFIGNSQANSTTNTFTWSAGTMIYFMYDGTYYKYITSIADGGKVQAFGANTWYGICSTTASTQEKAINCTNYVLTQGSLISIYSTSSNTYTSAKITLNVNSTGAKDVYYKGYATSSSNTLLWDAGDVLTFMYDGTYYRFVSRSTNTAPLTIRTWS